MFIAIWSFSLLYQRTKYSKNVHYYALYYTQWLSHMHICQKLILFVYRLARHRNIWAENLLVGKTPFKVPSGNRRQKPCASATSISCSNKVEKWNLAARNSNSTQPGPSEPNPTQADLAKSFEEIAKRNQWK